eukprot:1804419-Ditylum_brightwellii.AAC.1
MTTVTKPLKQPCILYETKVKHLDLKRVKLVQSYDDGTAKIKKCPVFLGTEGIEGLLYVEERFCSIAWQLHYTTGVEIFDNFKEILTNSVEEKWGTLTSIINPAA